MSPSDDIFVNFLGQIASGGSRAVIIPAPIEVTTSFQFGTSRAPQAVLKASQHIDSFDLESEKDLSEIGILTYGAKDYKGLRAEDALSHLQSEVERALEENLFPVILGGESSLSISAVKALQKDSIPLSVLRLDSRPKVRESFEGNSLSHLCSTRRIIELGVKTVLLGVRSYSQEEWNYSKAQNILVVKGLEPDSLEETSEWISKELTEKVFISISADAFDPSEVPGSAYQEPQGLRWNSSLEILRHIFSEHDVVGFDLCDLRPIQGSAQSEVYFAKLLAKLLAIKFL